MGEAVQVPSAAGPLRAYLATPPIGEGTPLLVLHGGRGLTGFFRELTDRLAGDGHLTLAVDLFDGKVAGSPAEAQAMFRSLDTRMAQTQQQLSDAVDFVARHPASTGEGIGVVGLSLGGHLALALSDPKSRSDRVRAVVTFYGLNPAVDYPRTTTAYLGHFAEHDAFWPADQVRRQEATLREARRQADFFVYAGTRHGFFEKDRPEFDADAAEVAWDRTVSFLDRILR